MPSTSRSIPDLSLYLVTDANMCAKRGLIETVCAAIEGGVSFVQLRDKTSDDERLYQIACELKEAVAGRVPLVINDRVLIAKRAQLDGAHIGQTDIEVEQARDILGNDAILGLTINNMHQLQHAQTYHLPYLDYFGIGPVYSTQTKPNHAQPLAPEGLKTLVTTSQLPTVAIGGIQLANARDVYRTGCSGIAVVSAICAAEDPKFAAQALLEQQSN
ncbi:thiamine phosphate synthase [Psychrobacter sp. FDAARGOS_221]|uniref:thiamine phosphate synthase n=1 Tax=Psychrobacter sp. FDAARGOS_221 TaxID=1975705 RepID=UPI000BB544D0|nr:thiamine phosphate synthase [Psychrobacter sp. FDAARGOS_221]PNK61596.1 thiamine phosphate synthase [Psychrobacter sp. FDAARGOS_221]